MDRHGSDHLKSMESLGPGLWALDTGFQRQRFDAAYLLAEAGRAAFVDTGPNLAVPGLLQILDDLGFARSDVEWVILTHVHHPVCIWDESSHGWFSGDTLGVSHPEFDLGAARFGIPSTTPTQFDPEALYRSVERLMSANPAVAYITHYGAVRDVAA